MAEKPKYLQKKGASQPCFNENYKFGLGNVSSFESHRAT